MTLPVHVTVLELLVELNPAVRANASKAINCVWWMVLGGRVRLRGRERVCVCVCVWEGCLCTVSTCMCGGSSLVHTAKC